EDDVLEDADLPGFTVTDPNDPGARVTVRSRAPSERRREGWRARQGGRRRGGQHTRGGERGREGRHGRGGSPGGSRPAREGRREEIEGMKPPSGGLIVRTVAEGLTKKQLKQDVGYLVRLWGEIAKKRETANAPAPLSSELDLVLKTARDLFTDEVDEIVID